MGGSDVYGRLRERLDEYSHGFAATESGVEMEVLRRVFTEEEAEMYLSLTAQLRTAEEIAREIGKSPQVVEEILQRMTKKGHTFPRFPKRPGERTYYAAAPWSHGIWEHIARRLDEETAQLIDAHFKAGVFTRGPIAVRNIPVGSAVDPALAVAPYDDVKSIVLTKDLIVLTACACHDMRQVLGQGCNQPREVCMMFDFYADYYKVLGMGRPISKEEAVAKLQEAERAGLVHQMANSQDPGSLCNCCRDCCQGLLFLKGLRRPAAIAATNYYSSLEADSCTGCYNCVDRCPMGAISVAQEGTPQVNSDRCIGCGLCVSACPEGALKLHLKPEEQRRVPPAKGIVMKSSKEMEATVKGPFAPR